MRRYLVSGFMTLSLTARIRGSVQRLGSADNELESIGGCWVRGGAYGVIYGQQLA